MLRGIAFLVIICACGTYGLIMAQRYIKRPKQLRAFQQAIESITTEISYGATPLPQALKAAAIGIEPSVGEFFFQCAAGIEQGLTAGQAWQQTSENVRAGLCLNAEDWKLVLSLGVGLGTTDKTEEKKKLQLVSLRLAAQEERAAEQSGKLAKMWSYLGFLAGATIVLIIL